MACSSSCMANSETGSCCVLDETAASDATPLGFILYTLPGVDSDVPAPCARVNVQSPRANNYVVVAVSNILYTCYFECISYLVGIWL